MGYEIKFCPQAVLYHRLSASWKKSLKSLYLSHRNFIRASLKNYSLSNLLKNIPPLVVVSLCFGLFGTIQSRNKTFLLTMIKAVWHNSHLILEIAHGPSLFKSLDLTHSALVQLVYLLMCSQHDLA